MMHPSTSPIGHRCAMRRSAEAIASPVGINPANPPKSLSDWYLSAYPQFLEGFPALPLPPFELRQGVRVLGVRFYDRLTFEVRRVQACGASPRFHTGALQQDLRDLYRLTVEGNKPRLSALQEWELEHLDLVEEAA